MEGVRLLYEVTWIVFVRDEGDCRGSENPGSAPNERDIDTDFGFATRLDLTRRRQPCASMNIGAVSVGVPIYRVLRKVVGLSVPHAVRLSHV